jgi:plasmid stabilization system protein ParE
MKRAVWTRPAQDDFARIDDHYQQVSPDFADRLGLAALRAARFLAEHANAGSPLALGTRKWRIGRHDYVLIYRVVDAGVEILRMRHLREDWRTEFE